MRVIRLIHKQNHRVFRRFPFIYLLLRLCARRKCLIETSALKCNVLPRLTQQCTHSNHTHTQHCYGWYFGANFTYFPSLINYNRTTFDVCSSLLLLAFVSLKSIYSILNRIPYGVHCLYWIEPTVWNGICSERVCGGGECILDLDLLWRHTELALHLVKCRVIHAHI